MKLHHHFLDSISARLARGVAALSCGVALGAWAAAPGGAEESVDPPGRVGRISDTTGQVWFYAPDAGEWISAVRNRPITTGNRLSTDSGARAEVRIGSTTLRLDWGTEIEVLRLDDERMALQLHSGSAWVRLRSHEAAGEFEMVTDEGRFRTQRTGRYRFDRDDAASHLTVHSGQAVYEGPGSALTVYSAQRAEFWIDRANAAQYTITDPQRDAFAAWNSERDRSDDRSASARYVSPEMTGAEDLDRHGRWEQSPEYGPLWIPRVVAPGWAPYSTGHWTWVHPWGWTWVDDAPWGFAPFHYGRWVWFRSAWCWAPGTHVHRPVYAPALVAWIGGSHVSASISIGGAPAVGWFPLAPREVYVPTYRTSPRYVRNVNLTHVTTYVNNPQTAPPRDFSNRKFPHAVTVVPASVMQQRQPVAPAAAQLRDSPLVRELVRDPGRSRVAVAPPVTPTHVPAGAATAAPPTAPPSPSTRIIRGPSERSGNRADERRRHEPQDAPRAMPATPPPQVALPAVNPPIAPAARAPSPMPQPPATQAPAAPPPPVVMRQTRPSQVQDQPSGQPPAHVRPAPQRDAGERGGRPVPPGEARVRGQQPAPVQAPRPAAPAPEPAPGQLKKPHVQPPPQDRPAEPQHPRSRPRDARDERARERVQ